MAYYYWQILNWVANVLPYRLGRALFTGLGWLSFHFGGQWRENALDNMRHVLGASATDKEVKAAAQAAMIHQLTNYYLLLRPTVSDEEWPTTHTVEGWEHFDTAVAAGKGVIALSAHLGGVEHLAEVVRRDRGLRPLAPAEHIKPERLYHWFVALRERRGGRGIPADQSGFEVIRALRRGEVVALGGDLDATRQGMVVEFFGAPAVLPQGPARLALLTGSPVIPMFAIRNPDWTFRVIIDPPVVFQRSGDREADLAAAMRQVAAVLERHIRAHPTQWAQFNPIWQWAKSSRPDVTDS